jgi:ABC-type Fe3+/spermidine/putrescine transport system ATPase subunit
MAGNIHGRSPVALSIRNLTKIFRGKGERVTALENVSIDIQEGELFTLLGPSGCGKTTTLRCIAGFEKPTGGKINFLDNDFTTIPPSRRNIGMVFQSYALFPHMSIFENVAYGLKIRKNPRREIEQKVDGILKLVGLDTTKQRKPSELSGGQQQRIALARALVYDPQLLLLDEPLSNLDAKLRVYMRGEIRRIQQRAKVTTLYVTHDQEEALSISDRIAVMHAGNVSQIGTPDEIYEDPNSIQVADFIGQANFFQCGVKKQGSELLVLTFPSGESVSLNSTSALLSNFPYPKGILFSRPEQIKVISEPGRPNTLKGKVKSILYLGSVVRYFIEVFEHTISQEVLVDEDRRIKGVREGDAVDVVLPADDVKLFPLDQKDQLQKESG